MKKIKEPQALAWCSMLGAFSAAEGARETFSPLMYNLQSRPLPRLRNPQE